MWLQPAPDDDRIVVSEIGGAVIAEDGTRKGGRQGHGHDLTGSSLADEDDNGNKDPKSTPCRSDGKGQSCGYEKDDGWNQFHRQMALLNEHADEFPVPR